MHCSIMLAMLSAGAKKMSFEYFWVLCADNLFLDNDEANLFDSLEFIFMEFLLGFLKSWGSYLV